MHTRDLCTLDMQFSSKLHFSPQVRFFNEENFQSSTSVWLPRNKGRTVLLVCGRWAVQQWGPFSLLMGLGVLTEDLVLVQLVNWGTITYNTAHGSSRVVSFTPSRPTIDLPAPYSASFQSGPPWRLVPGPGVLSMGAPAATWVSLIRNPLLESLSFLLSYWNWGLGPGRTEAPLQHGNTLLKALP